MRWPMIKVLANGVFDLPHFGHLTHLREAASMGDRLIVALTVDGCVNKPGRPILPWDQRAEILLEWRCVDEVIPTTDAVSAIRTVKPQIFVKGSDYADGDRFTEDVVAACKEVGAKLVFTQAPKESTTQLIERIKCVSS